MLFSDDRQEVFGRFLTTVLGFPCTLPRAFDSFDQILEVQCHCTNCGRTLFDRFICCLLWRLIFIIRVSQSRYFLLDHSFGFIVLPRGAFVPAECGIDAGENGADLVLVDTLQSCSFKQVV